MADPGVLQRLQPAGDPVPDPAAVVVVEAARFTVLTDRLIRLEWSSTGAFEDRASFAFPHRRAAVPAFTVHTDRGVTVLDTGALVLRYAPDGGPFTASNLSVDLAHHGGEWVPGQRDPANLGGARRTVDGCRGDAALEPGLVSRSGWALVDDSRAVRFGADGWVEPPADHDGQDWYFFGYGHDFAAAVSDYTRFGGRMPLVPRWVLGSWWSRYFAYNEDHLR
jgi:hypothetical protein